MELDDAAAIGLTEMMHLKRQQLQRSEEEDRKRTYLGGGGQVLPISSLYDPADHIHVSSFYEIDHSTLPPKSSVQLINSIRVVMVKEKTRMRVSLRFPSIYSLRAYFNDGDCNKPGVKKQLPAMDEKYTMGSEVAAEALYRRIPPLEIAEKGHLWSFWVVIPSPPATTHQKVVVPSPPSSSRNERVVVSKKGFLWSELKSPEMVKWAQQRQVRFLARHVDDKHELMRNTVSTNMKGKEAEKGIEHQVVSEGEEERQNNIEEDEEEDEKQEEEEDVKAHIAVRHQAKRNCKRKRRECYPFKTQKKKRPKREKKNQIVVYKQRKNKVLKNSIDRWSVERYKLAEVNMLKVMKEQVAVFGNPMLRPELRAEARKLIGDTGLLDHLLKHMAGKVAPGGEERFRRRHNADGAMEYWLEKADLVDIRKQAGVQDPYWTPPPGWKPGDNPTQDPVCAREIKELKEEMAKMKKDMEELKSKRHGEELAIVTTPTSSIASQNKEHYSLLIPLKEMYIDLVNKKSKIEEQLKEISESLCGMEEEMGQLKTTLEETNRTESEERPALIMGIPKESGVGRRKEELVVQQKKEANIASGVLQQEHGNMSRGNNVNTPAKTKSSISEKAAKIERLKSGFRICKPQGSFLWPNMASPQDLVQLEDLLAVPTPPSVSSTSARQTHLLSPPSQHHGPHPPSPVKPLAEKRPVTTINPLSTAVANSTYLENSSNTPISAATTKTPLINLNEPFDSQTDHDNEFCGPKSSHVHSSPYPVTYQRRHHQNGSTTTTTAMPCLVAGAGKEMSQWNERNEMLGYCEQQQQRGCSSASSTPRCSPVGAGMTWLALATTTSSDLDDQSNRG